MPLLSLSLSLTSRVFGSRPNRPPPACRASPMRQRPSPNRLRRERNVVLRRSIRSSEIPSSILFSSSEIRDSIGGKNTLIVDRSRNRLQLLEILEKKHTRERVKRGTKKFHCGFFSTREREKLDRWLYNTSPSLITVTDQRWLNLPCKRGLLQGSKNLRRLEIRRGRERVWLNEFGPSSLFPFRFDREIGWDKGKPVEKKCIG